MNYYSRASNIHHGLHLPLTPCQLGVRHQVGKMKICWFCELRNAMRNSYSTTIHCNLEMDPWVGVVTVTGVNCGPAYIQTSLRAS